jgi:hypothetical protein
MYEPAGRGTQTPEDKHLNYYCLLGPNETTPSENNRYLTYRGACSRRAQIGSWMTIYKVTPEMMFLWGSEKIAHKNHKELDKVAWSPYSLRRG